MPAPAASVVIPASRPARLAFALEALAEQTVQPERFEVIVVRDRDTGLWPPTPSGLQLRLLAGAGDGNVAALRNRGWREASAPLVAFTDDDCRPEPGWLEALLDAFADEGTILQGRTEPDPAERHLAGGLARTQRITELGGWYETCNVAYPRALIERLGGFDERFGAIGEDTDLAWRALEVGARSRFVSDAVVWHAVLPRTTSQALREIVRLRDAPAVVGRHPGLRESLYRGYFWNPGHHGVSILVASLPFARRHPAVALAAALPYLAYRVNWRQPTARRIARGLLSAPALAALDLTELIVRLPSAVRHHARVV